LPEKLLSCNTIRRKPFAQAKFLDLSPTLVTNLKVYMDKAILDQILSLGYQLSPAMASTLRIGVILVLAWLAMAFSHKLIRTFPHLHQQQHARWRRGAAGSDAGPRLPLRRRR
jgi:hypothetical protein